MRKLCCIVEKLFEIQNKVRKRIKGTERKYFSPIISQTYITYTYKENEEETKNRQNKGHPKTRFIFPFFLQNFIC